MTLHMTDLSAEIGPRDAEVVTPSSLKGRGAGQGGSFYRKLAKRGLDVLAVVLTAPLTVPLIAILSLIVASGGHAPLYSQDRIGRGGKVFRMWKLRTMVHNADEKLEEYLASNPDARVEWNHKQKLTNDPRVTRVGRWLRKSSLDELPQLWNVLNGSMSLVGPRPMMVNQQESYDGTAYYRLRPGMTGFWQIAERNCVSFSGRIDFDEQYDRELTLGIDLRVLAQTVVVVCRGTGC